MVHFSLYSIPFLRWFSLRNIIALLAVTVLLAGSGWLWYQLHWPKSEENEARGTLGSRKFTDPATCLKILNGESYDESLGTNQLSLVKSRGIPNERLVRAFGIDNGFTTKDRAYSREFRKAAEKQIGKVTSLGWREISIEAQKFASAWHDKPPNQSCVESIAQNVTLKLVLSLFFSVKKERLINDRMLRIADDINYLWIDSKSDTNPISARGCDDLKKNLKDLGLKVNSAHPKTNPLNILLPAYETLWRIVARCFIEVVFRPSADPAWLALLKGYLENPTPEFFDRTDVHGTVSVKFLVQEALRMYPPTRRVYRQMHLSSTEQPELVAANIEACHRLAEIWGDDSHSYRPARWSAATKSMKDAFMPFGGGSWACPAKAIFGPRLIGLLVAALASNITSEEWELEYQGKYLQSPRVFNDKKKLDSNRKMTSPWEIVRKVQIRPEAL
ncbi:MAG: hypothetical protein Q9170_003781 [Blastenia crenularia]